MATAPYNEMYPSEGAARAHYQRYAEWLRAQPPETLARKRTEADALFHRVGITFAVYGRERHRAADPFRHRAAHHSGGGVGAARGGTGAARARVQRLHRRHLPRATDPAGGRDPGGAGALQRAIPARDAGCGSTRATSTPTSPASTWCATAGATSACWRTICACPRASRTCSRTAR